MGTGGRNGFSAIVKRLRRSSAIRKSSCEKNPGTYVPPAGTGRAFGRMRDVPVSLADAQAAKSLGTWRVTPSTYVSVCFRCTALRRSQTRLCVILFRHKIARNEARGVETSPLSALPFVANSETAARQREQHGFESLSVQRLRTHVDGTQDREVIAARRVIFTRKNSARWTTHRPQQTDRILRHDSSCVQPADFRSCIVKPWYGERRGSDG